MRFDEDLARRIAAQDDGPDWPVIPTMAGHDAGVLSAAGIPTAMLFVRNPTGVSHSPAEHAETGRLPGRRRGAGRHPPATRRMTAYWLERALVGGDVLESVRVEVDDGVFTAVTAGAPWPAPNAWPG